MNNDEMISVLLSQMNERFDKIDERLEKLEQGLDVVQRSAFLAETVEHPRIQASLDGILSVFEHNEQSDSRLRLLERKVERHDTEIHALQQIAK
ncbi:MAG: hypothetical protein FWF08_08170 [Oscillospiraceae bacterium]|nr:hypothetical protein [Oscillospiraceae bacterium]